MKYKTLFRMLMKAIGVWVFVEGIGGLLGQFGYLVFVLTSRVTMPAGQSWFYLVNMVGPLAQLSIGAYLFFGGKWIVDRAIPGNRPYCHECGYDLTDAAGTVCTECGTPFRPAETSSAP